MNANQIAQIAASLNVSPNQIKRAEEWKNVLFVVVQSKGARFVSKKVIKEQITMALFQVKTGSEWHSTETRGAMVTVNGEPIYKVLKAKTQKWSEVGNKGRHGKWCIAEYEIPTGSAVSFTATANGKEKIEQSFIVSDDAVIDFDGYDYASDTCGWIVSI